MYLVQKVAPINDLLSLDEAKSFMRILDNDSDSDIQAIIKSCIEYVENYTNRQFITATYELYTETFIKNMRLPKNPIQSITSIEYLDEDGVYQTLSTDYYYIYGENGVSKIYFQDTLPTHKEHKNAIRITFIAGYGDDSTSVPESIKSCVKVLVSTLYENREHYVVGFTSVSIETEANPIIDKMLCMYKVREV